MHVHVSHAAPFSSRLYALKGDADFAIMFFDAYVFK